METKIRLLMTFKDADGNRVSLSVDNPREDVTEEEIIAVMNLVLEKDIFAPNGVKLDTLVEAKVVETNTTSHDLVL